MSSIGRTSRHPTLTLGRMPHNPTLTLGRTLRHPTLTLGRTPRHPTLTLVAEILVTLALNFGPLLVVAGDLADLGSTSARDRVAGPPARDLG